MAIQTIDTLQKRAFSLMEEAGYAITKEITFEVDPQLSFMGYTTEREGKTVIVVAGWSLSSSMSLGLVIHELSHVYRLQTHHPSHNSFLHMSILKNLMQKRVLTAPQYETIFTLINHIQDLYADDISFAVYLKDSVEDMSEFFLGWIHPAVDPLVSEEDRWENAARLVSAAFAQANLIRHHQEDGNGKIERAISKLLAASPPAQAEKYEYFRDFMLQLPEALSDTAFSVLLTEYLTKYLLLADRREK